MLHRLSIRNYLLIDQLDLDVQPGLTVLTGETGAGKSILLEALGLVLGARIEGNPVRAGADQAVLTAVFDMPEQDELRSLFAEQGLEVDENALVIRRVIDRQNKSRAFVNDQPVTLNLLKSLGQVLLEIHGQFANQALLSASNHGPALDAFGGHLAQVKATAKAFGDWKAAERAVAGLQQELAQAAREADYLRHVLEELTALDPQPGEEETLAAERTAAMAAEKELAACHAALEELSGANDPQRALLAATRKLASLPPALQDELQPVTDALDQAGNLLADALFTLQRRVNAVELDQSRLDAIEERLFALRAASRKHQVPLEDLPGLKSDIAARVGLLDRQEQALQAAREQCRITRVAYQQAAKALTTARQEAVPHLTDAVMAELHGLKLGKAVFSINLDALPEPEWGGTGQERVTFWLQTNPGLPAGPLHKIASGGELARIQLALKTALAAVNRIPTLIFDEVDIGVGGAVAAAVGERLARLAGTAQVLVITHSPQVAAAGHQHWRIAKTLVDAMTVTRVSVLDSAARQDEIARMLAGAEVTAEARAAAQKLLIHAADCD